MSKQVKVYRQSGEPVNLESREAFRNDFRDLFDKVEKKVDVVFNKSTTRIKKAPKMHIMERMLRFGERQLVKKHNIEVLVDLPQTSDEWKALMESYEQCPLMTAVDTRTQELVILIMDLYGRS